MNSKTILVLRALEKEMKPVHGTEVFVVGEYVRDILRKKKPSNDIQVIIRHLSMPKIEHFLSSYGDVTTASLAHNPSTNILLFKAYDDEVLAKITLSNGGNKKSAINGTASLRQDSQQKCFALDAMYLPINALVPTRVIDYVGGKSDIAARTILSIGNAAAKFKKDPTQILRAFSLAAITGYNINSHVRHAITECAYLLKRVPASVVKDELITILTSNKPSIQLRLMLKLGVLHIIMPELVKCNGCLQDSRYHKYDVFNHLLYTCDNTDKNDLILRLAGLLHDIGKPESMEIKPDGKVTFYRHEMYGTKLVGPMLYRLGFNQDVIEPVTQLVRMHMYHYTREYTDAGVNKFITMAGITDKDIDNLDQFPLFKLRAAERLGNGFKKSGITPRQCEFQERIIKVFKNNASLSIKNLAISGAELMEIFNIAPGPEVGVILRHLLLFASEDSSLNEYKTLLHCALDYILDKKENGEGKG